MAIHRTIQGGFGRLLLICSVLTFTCLTGCKDDEAAVKAAEEKKEAAKVEAKKAEEAKVRALPLPMSPVDLFRKLPKVPPGMAVFPGTSIAALKKKRPGLKASAYSPLWLTEHPKDGPFRMVHYQLSKDKKRVNAVLGTFVEGYNLKERKDALTEAIKIRLGEGEAFSENQYEGRRWRLIDFRLDLRTDKVSKGLELLVHNRGRFDPVSPGGKP